MSVIFPFRPPTEIHALELLSYDERYLAYMEAWFAFNIFLGVRESSRKERVWVNVRVEDMMRIEKDRKVTSG